MRVRSHNHRTGSKPRRKCGVCWSRTGEQGSGRAGDVQCWHAAREEPEARRPVGGWRVDRDAALLRPHGADGVPNPASAVMPKQLQPSLRSYPWVR
jgi:hypothetical protein